MKDSSVRGANRTLLAASLLAMPLLALWTATVQARGTHAADRAATHTAHGVRLTLIVHRTAYPVNALAAVTVVTKNISRHPVWILANTPRYGVVNPSIVSQDRYGRQAVLPTLAEFGFPSYPQSSARSIRLRSGQAVQSQRFVVVSGVRLVAHVTETTNPSAWTETSTPPIWVTLEPGDAPHLVVHGAGTDVFATVASQFSDRAPTYDVSSTRCAAGGGDRFVAHGNWLPLPRTRVSPDCGPVSEWHLVVGRLNHSVASADYAYPARSGAPPLPTPKPTGPGLSP
jgi:hypothetical protein